MITGKVLALRFVERNNKTGMNKLELTNMVEVKYCKDKNDVYGTLRVAMVNVPEESLPPMSEEEKKYGRLLDVYFKKASEILENEIGPINIYENRFIGKITVLHGIT